MRDITPFMIFILFVSLSCAELGSASSLFKVVEVSPIHLAPGDEANFTVRIKSLGSQGQYVKPVFKNLTEGLSTSEAVGLKYILPTGNRTYNLTLRAGNISPGNYSFQVGIFAKGAPSSWRTAYAVIEAPKIEANISGTGPAMPEANHTAPDVHGQETEKSGLPQGAAGPGILIAVAAIILASRISKD